MSNAIFVREYSEDQERANDGSEPLVGELTIYLQTIGPNAEIQEKMKKEILEEVERITRAYSLKEYERGR